MLINSETWPEHRKWVVAVLVVALAAIGLYWVETMRSNDSRWLGGSSRPGLLFGIVAGAIIVFEILLWPRKWPGVRAWRIGRTQTWLRAHIWLGLLSVPLVVLHHGLAFEWGGPLTVLLMVLYWAVIASGVLGLYLQQILPRHMLHTLPAESIVSQIPHLTAQMVTDIERVFRDAGGAPADEISARGDEASDESASRFLVVGAVRTVGHVGGRVLETKALAFEKIDRTDLARLKLAFGETIRPYLLRGGGGEKEIGNVTAAATYFSSLRGNVTTSRAAELVDSLAEYCNIRRQYDRQRRIHRLLHGWISIHLPLSLLLFAILIAHGVSAIRYAGIWPW